MDHQTPFLACDLETVRERYAHLTAALPGVRCFYAVKCNSDPERLLYSNTVKPAAHIAESFAAGLWRYAFDSEGELYKLAQHAPGSAVYVRLRIDDSTSLFPLSRKFGAEAQEARALLLLARSLWLRPYGVTFESALHELLPYRPELLAVEPGRYLVAESAVLVGGVLGREVRAGENWAYLDVGAYNGLMETQQTVNQWRYPLWSSRPDHTVRVAAHGPGRPGLGRAAGGRDRLPRRGAAAHLAGRRRPGPRARGSVAGRVEGRRGISTAPERSGPLTGLLASGGLVMLLGSVPTLLAIGLAAELHGTRWVAGSALAFALGSLLAPLAVARLERRAVPPSIAWPALGVGMAAGWTFAAWHPFALLAAQLLSGMCMSALEGDMDARIAASNAAPRGVTANLATAAALRAFGSAAAVALAPRVIAANGVGALSIALVTVLAAAVVVTLARHRNHWGLSRTGAATNPG